MASIDDGSTSTRVASELTGIVWLWERATGVIGLSGNTVKRSLAVGIDKLRSSATAGLEDIAAGGVATIIMAEGWLGKIAGGMEFAMADGLAWARVSIRVKVPSVQSVFQSLGLAIGRRYPEWM